MKTFTLTLLFLLYSQLLASELFTPTYSFKNISFNYLDWTSKTENSTTQEDFAYLEAEGGAGFSWGDVYMFLDIQNPTKSYSDEPSGNLRFVFKPVVNIKLTENFSLYFQSFTLQSKDFYTLNPVLGVAYKVTTKSGFWIQPFLGLHYQANTFDSGFNGYMAGWVFMYNFSIAQEKFSISQWNQHTFEREDNNIGTQGAIAFYWNPIDAITTGIQYRYAVYELGSNEYQDGIIYTIKYNF